MSVHEHTEKKGIFMDFGHKNRYKHMFWSLMQKTELFAVEIENNINNKRCKMRLCGNFLVILHENYY